MKTSDAISIIKKRYKISDIDLEVARLEDELTRIEDTIKSLLKQRDDAQKENMELKWELPRLKGMVREMGEILQATLPLTHAASDWAIRYEIDALNDEALAVNAMFFAKGDDGILSRPEVKAILEER